MYVWWKEFLRAYKFPNSVVLVMKKKPPLRHLGRPDRKKKKLLPSFVAPGKVVKQRSWAVHIADGYPQKELLRWCRAWKQVADLPGCVLVGRTQEGAWGIAILRNANAKSQDILISHVCFPVRKLRDDLLKSMVFMYSKPLKA